MRLKPRLSSNQHPELNLFENMDTKQMEIIIFILLFLLIRGHIEVTVAEIKIKRYNLVKIQKIKKYSSF